MEANLFGWGGAVTSQQRQALTRSLSNANVGTILMIPAISRVLQMLTNRQLGVQSTLPHKPGSSDGYYSQRRAAATTGAAWIADTAEPVESEGGYTQVKFAYKTLIGRIKITRRVIEQGRSYADVLSNELMGKSEDWANQLESTSIIGNTAAAADEIDGLLTLIGNVSGQTVANTTASGGDVLRLTKMDAAIQAVRGNANKARMRLYYNYSGQRLLNNALQAQQRFLPDNYTIDGGFVVNSYQGIPCILSTGIPDTLTYVGAAPKITVFSGAGTTAIIVVNTDYVFYSDLTPLTAMPLAKKSSQYDEVDVFADLVLVLDNTLGGAILAGLNPALA